MNHPPAIFVGDAPGLDFLNSIATPVDTPVDWIADGEGLLRWLGQAALVPNDVLQSMRDRVRPAELHKIAGQGRELREWFRVFVQQHKGRPLTAAALAKLAPLNELLAHDETFRRLAASPSREGGALRVETVRRWRRPEALLLPIAEALADLVATEDFSDVKACEGPACTLLFADHTRGHARRWCSMAICGNRSKQAAHRERLKAHRY